MRTLTRSEAAAWCKQHSVVLDASDHPEAGSKAMSFEIPVDSGKRIHLVTCHLKEVATASDTLVWFTEWGVWPSSERPHIFERFRLSYGERRALFDAPAHVFATEEFEDLVSFVVLGVLFLWDLYVVAPDGRVLHYSHDECGWLRGHVA